MELIKTVQKYEDRHAVLFCEQDAPWFSQLLCSSSVILHFADHEEVLDLSFLDRGILYASILDEYFQIHQDVLLKILSPGHLGIEVFVELASDTVSRMTDQFDFSSCSTRNLELLFSLLSENKDIITQNLELSRKFHQAEMELRQLRSDLVDSMNSRVFSSRRFLVDWLLDNHHELEKDLVLLHRNYPRMGLEGLGKSQIDFLFQDSLKAYLLIEIAWWDDGFEEEILRKILRLDQAAMILCREMSVPEFKVRKMLITNHSAWGIEDACIINNVEFVWIQALFRMNITKKE